MDLFFSTGVFKGFNGIVKSTGPWITVSKTVDLTKAFYGTKPKVVNTAFNFLKWMLRINSIKNLIKKLSKTLFKFGIGFTKKIAKISAKIATFIGKKTVRGIISVSKFIGKNTLKLAKGAFEKIKKILKRIITPFKRFGKVIKNKVIKWFRRIKNTFKMVIRKISKPIKKLLTPVLAAIKSVKKLYGNVKNFIVTKTGAMWNKGKTAFTKVKNSVKGFKKNAVMLMSKKKNEIVGKATGFGRNVEAFKLKTKKKAIQRGKAAAKWVKNTKMYKGAAKTAKFAAKLVGWVAAGIKWFFRIFKQIFKVIFTNILKPIASLIGTTLAAPTIGLSFLIPIICGIIFEFWMIKDEFFEAGWFKRLKMFGEFLLDVLTWCVPGGIAAWGILAIQLAPLIAEFGPMMWGAIRGQWDEYQEWKAQGLDEYGSPGNDVVFNVETSTKLENIKDLEKSTFTRRFLYAKNKTDQYNKNIIDIIDCIQTNQQKRTILLQNCNSVFAAYPTF